MNSEISYYNSVDCVANIISGNSFFVTDTTVYKNYSRLFASKKGYKISAGEESKNMQTALQICQQMLQDGCNRDTVIVAVGGGVVGDVAGFCASIFMRGIKWINVATTLLAQVDSSIGGKTGVDFNGYKNTLGAFNLPQQVVICSDFLLTLPSREWTCGIGEVIKTAMLSQQIFAYLLDNYSALLSRDAVVSLAIVKMCSAFKQAVITRDFLEQGERKNLNIGHTIGHALEGANNYAASHGEYVLWGLKAESYIFKNMIDPQFYSDVTRVIDYALSGLKLEFDSSKVAQIATGDKKNHDDKICIMLCLSAGKTTQLSLSKNELLDQLNNWRTSL